MILIVDDKEFSKLIDNRILKPSPHNDNYLLYLWEHDVHDVDALEVQIKSPDEFLVKEPTKDSATNTKKNNSKGKDYWDEKYKEYQHCFPTDINKLLKIDDEGISLRTGKPASIILSLQKLEEAGFDLNDVFEAARYEIWFRTQRSLESNTNELQYMGRSASWCNQTGNIETQIERSKESIKYKEYKNGTDDSARAIAFDDSKFS